MTKTKNIQLVYAGIGIALALAVSIVFISGALAEGKSYFRRGAYSSEARHAIYTALGNADYDAYVKAVTEVDGQGILTEEEFARHAEEIARKQQIHETIIANDYNAYRQLTDGSIRQLSEVDFHKKAQKIALMHEIKTAIENRDYDAFRAKKQELKDLLSDDMHHGHDYNLLEETTEEAFNALADKVEQHGWTPGTMLQWYNEEKERQHQR